MNVAMLCCSVRRKMRVLREVAHCNGCDVACFGR